MHPFAHAAFAERYPHKTVANAIIAPNRVRLTACCNNKTRNKELAQFMLRKVSNPNPEKNISTGYQLTDEFESRYIGGVLNYEPTLSQLISTDNPQSTIAHPFRSMVPVDLQSMRNTRNELTKYVKYYKGTTKTKPKHLRNETDVIYAAEKFKHWAGKFPEGSEDRELCPEKRSPKQRTVNKLVTLHDYLGNLIEIAINNDGHVPMHYRHNKHSPRFYATSAFNVQSCPTTIRSSCFSGCTEYDITSCNQTILLDYARRNNLLCEALAELVISKQAILKVVVIDTQISIDNLKLIFLAICNNAKLVKPKIAIGILWKKLYQYSAVEACHLIHDIAKIIWCDCRSANRYSFAEKYTTLYEHPFVRAYVSEVDAIAKHMQHDIPGFMDHGKGTLSSALANYTQRIEVMALIEMYKAFSTALVPIHDAVICTEPGDIELAQHRMQSVTGVKFRLRKTLL